MHVHVPVRRRVACSFSVGFWFSVVCVQRFIYSLYLFLSIAVPCGNRVRLTVALLLGGRALAVAGETPGPPLVSFGLFRVKESRLLGGCTCATPATYPARWYAALTALLLPSSFSSRFRRLALQDRQTTLDRPSVAEMGNCSSVLNLAGSLVNIAWGVKSPTTWLEDTTSKQNRQHRVSISRQGSLSCLGYPRRLRQLQCDGLEDHVGMSTYHLRIRHPYTFTPFPRDRLP